MAQQDRLKLIQGLEKKRGSKIICYVNSDRPADSPIPGINTQLSSEAQIFFLDHLRSINKQKQIDLFLYTRGGETDSVWPLVSTVREYCKKFNILVPFRAHSAGTLICFGADNIVMAKSGELGPIDPTTGNQFNPRVNDQDPNSPQLGISVEDVVSYIALAKEEKVGIKGEQQVLEVFKELTKRIHPLALGNVQRIYSQIRLLARNLLQLHLDGKTDEGKINDIVCSFTEKFYTHAHSISRKQAVQFMGDEIIKNADDEEENLMWQLWEDYAKELELRDRFNLKGFMGNNTEKTMDNIKGGFIESTELQHTYLTNVKITQNTAFPSNFNVQVQPGQQVPLSPGFPTNISLEIIKQKWEVTWVKPIDDTSKKKKS